MSTFILKIPPLRERINDIPFLVTNILSKLSLKFNKKLLGITDEFMQGLKRNHWTGNVRELEQVITRHALIEENPVLEGKSFLTHHETYSKERKYSDNYHKAKQALADAEYNKTKAALALGISRKTLYLWLKQAGNV